MTKYRFLPALSLIFLLGLPWLAHADPTGEWLVHDQTAHIRILTCGQKLWGIISWVKTPGTDENNPDASKRNRSVLGIPILLGMQAAEDSRWQGNIYNADNGKTYEGNIHLISTDILHVSGCVLDGLLCGGEDWTRLPTTEDADTGLLCKQFGIPQ
jgi:uncharacterized protein (DUF2147 family)